MKYDFRTAAQKRTEERGKKVVSDFKKAYPKAPNATRAAQTVAELNGMTRAGVVNILIRAGIYQTDGNGRNPIITL